jgi:SAM-dependent methyltransferase
VSAPSHRLEREIAHDRRIAERAEEIWNWDSPAGRRRADRRAAFYVEHAGLGPGRLALELGCGTGLFLERVARSGATLVGVDLSADLLARARRRVAALPNVRVLEGDAHRLPFPDGSFDAVYGSSILHHLDLAAALAEARRALKRGGRVVFTEPNLLNPQVAYMYYVGPRERFGLSPDEMAFTKARVSGVLARAGFVDAVVRFFDFLHPATPAPLLDAVSRLGSILEGLPAVRALAGSLLVRATRG